METVVDKVQLRNGDWVSLRWDDRLGVRRLWLTTVCLHDGRPRITGHREVSLVEGQKEMAKLRTMKVGGLTE